MTSTHRKKNINAKNWFTERKNCIYEQKKILFIIPSMLWSFFEEQKGGK